MSAQDKLPAQTYISSPQNFQTSFIKNGGYALRPSVTLQSKPMVLALPQLEDRTAFVPVTKRQGRPRKYFPKK
jgi:hypothetical protein